MKYKECGMGALSQLEDKAPILCYNNKAEDETLDGNWSDGFGLEGNTNADCQALRPHEFLQFFLHDETILIADTQSEVGVLDT